MISFFVKWKIIPPNNPSFSLQTDGFMCQKLPGFIDGNHCLWNYFIHRIEEKDMCTTCFQTIFLFCYSKLGVDFSLLTTILLIAAQGLRELTVLERVCVCVCMYLCARMWYVCMRVCSVCVWFVCAFFCVRTRCVMLCVMWVCVLCTCMCVCVCVLLCVICVCVPLNTSPQKISTPKREISFWWF